MTRCFDNLCNNILEYCGNIINTINNIITILHILYLILYAACNQAFQITREASEIYRGRAHNVNTRRQQSTIKFKKST